MVKFGMCLSTHVNVQISPGGMVMNVSQFLNAKEVKHLMAYISVYVPMVMFGVQTLVLCLHA